jgi:anaerobic dimethyl sulfoxide reductase subunit A
MTLADEWIGIKPSTDGALADAMAYVIWSEGLHDRHFMDTYCVGFDEMHMPWGVPKDMSYEAYLFGHLDGVAKTPEWAAPITGVPADTITRLAREYATAKPACLLPGLGVQRIGNGEQTVRSLALLTCLTGNVGKRGGGAAGVGDVRETAWPALPLLTNPIKAKIPSFLWTRAIEHGVEMNKADDGLEGVERLDSNIKMIVNMAGNTLINQHSDINNTIRILKDTDKCEFILCSDVFMTPSARFADILLPAPSFFEDENIVAPWVFGSYLLYNNKVTGPLFECRFEYDFIRQVAANLGLLEQWQGGNERHTGWLAQLYGELREREPELPGFSEFKRLGGYRPKNKKPYIAYEDRIRGVESAPFDTPSGKIEIFSKALYDLGKPNEIPAIPRYTPCPEGPEDGLRERFPLQLIGYHSKNRCHSIHDKNEWLGETDPQRVWVNPTDAAKRGITDGAIVEVYNNRGRTRLPAYVTKRVIAGVVAISQGAWYAPDEDGTDTAGSLNVLTSTKPTPLAKGNPQHTNLVEVVLI